MKRSILFLLILSLSGVIFYLSPFYSKFNLPKLSSSEVASPLGQNEAVASATTTNKIWNPEMMKPNSGPPPVITAKSALAAELATEKIIFSKNPNLRLPVASLQKIVTAMVALDQLKEDTIITVSANASSREPDSMGLFPGEKLTLKQLLYGLILVSGNDSATAIAEGVSGQEDLFAKLMTAKAQSLGLQDSYFINASGLDEGHQYSSAFDLATLSINLLKNYPLLAKISASSDYRVWNTVDDTENHKEYFLHNTSPVLDLPGYFGVKPGYTPEAEWCLITLIKKGEHQFLIVIVGSEDRKGDTLALLDYLNQVYP